MGGWGEGWGEGFVAWGTLEVFVISHIVNVFFCTYDVDLIRLI
jgi:hypothetical protein